jgi:very-short-patch-repair endonuclease
MPSRNDAERRLHRLLDEAGLRPDATNATVAGWEVDAVWHEPRLVVELDGYQFHGTRAAFERDRRKDAALLAVGYRPLRVTWRRLTDEPLRLAAELGATLRA